MAVPYDGRDVYYRVDLFRGRDLLGDAGLSLAATRPDDAPADVPAPAGFTRV